MARPRHRSNPRRHHRTPPRIPQHRHRSPIPQRNRSRPRHRRHRHRPHRPFHHHQTPQRRPGIRPHPARLRRLPEQTRTRLRRPLPHPLARSIPRPLHPNLEGIPTHLRRRPRQSHRSIKLPHPTPGTHRHRKRPHPRRQPNRTTPLPTSNRTPRLPRRPRHSHRSLEPTRPRWTTTNRTRPHRHRPPTDKNSRPNHPSLAHPTRKHRHTQIGDPLAHQRKHRRLRFRTIRRAHDDHRHTRQRDTPGPRPRPHHLTQPGWAPPPTPTIKTATTAPPPHACRPKDGSSSTIPATSRQATRSYALTSCCIPCGPRASSRYETGTKGNRGPVYRTTLLRVCSVDSAANGLAPVDAITSTDPREKTSEVVVSGADSACSGDMNAGVPTTPPVRVSSDPATSTARTMPGAELSIVG